MLFIVVLSVLFASGSGSPVDNDIVTVVAELIEKDTEAKSSVKPILTGFGMQRNGSDGGHDSRCKIKGKPSIFEAMKEMKESQYDAFKNEMSEAVGQGNETADQCSLMQELLQMPGQGRVFVVTLSMKGKFFFMVSNILFSLALEPNELMTSYAGSHSCGIGHLYDKQLFLVTLLFLRPVVSSF